MRSLGSRVSPSPSCSWKTLIPPCINPVAYKAKRKPNYVVENDVVLGRCAPRFASHHERSAVWEVEAVYAALPSGKSLHTARSGSTVDQSERATRAGGRPEKGAAGSPTLLATLRGATACGGRHAGRWQG